MDVGSESGPIPAIAQVYLATSVTWGVLSVIWISNWSRFLSERVPLQRWLTLVAASKVIVSIVLYVYYREYDATGERPLPWSVAALCMIIFMQIVLFTAIIVVAKGLFITRLSLDPVEVRAIVWNAFFLGLSLSAFFFISVYFVFPLVVTYVVVFGHIYSGIANNLRGLSEHLLSLLAEGQPEDSISEQSDIAKFRLFKNLQKLVTCYLTISVVNYLVNPLFIDPDWIRLLIDEFAFLILVVGIGWLLRLRDFSNFRYPDENAAQGDVEQGASGDVSEEMPDIVVIANPPTCDENGKVLKENLVMGRRCPLYGASIEPSEGSLSSIPGSVESSGNSSGEEDN